MRHILFSVKAFAVVLVLSVFVFGQGGIKGKVRAQNGNALAGAAVEIRQDGREVKSAKTDQKGNFEVTGLSAGNYNLYFSAPGYAGGTLFNVKIDGNIRDLGDRLILSVDRGTLVLVTGSVFFKEGASLTGARVQIDEVRADGSTKKLGSGFTNSSGEFTFRMPPRAAKLRMTAKYKNANASKEVDVEDPAVYRTSLILDISRNDK